MKRVRESPILHVRPTLTPCQTSASSSSTTTLRGEVLRAHTATQAVLDARMAEANGGHVPWLKGCGEQPDGSHVCATAECIRVPRRMS